MQALRDLLAKDAGDARLEKYGRLLYDQAVIAEGSKVKDPVGFSQRINELIAKDARAAGESSASSSASSSA